MNYKTKLLRMGALVATTLLIASGAARAQDAPEAEREAMVLAQQAAEKLEREGKYLACGQAYLAIYKKNPDAADMDEVVYNAAVCFTDGKSISLAIRTYTMLEKRFPNSQKARKALVLMGNLHGSIANYEQAAEAYERFARRYPAEKEAPGALNIATTYRMAIGHDKEAIDNIESFVKKYKRKQKHETSSALFGLAGIYEQQGNRDMVVKTYKRYLKEFGRSGGLDRVLIANAKIGEILWKQSCRGATHDGTCFKRERVVAIRRKARKSAIPTQCGPKSKLKRTVLARDPRLVKEATQYFKWAVKMATKRAIENAPDPGRKAAAIYWMAASRFYLNEPKYEKFLAIELPAKLNFSGGTAKQEETKLESTKRFAQWLTDKSRSDNMVTSEYLEIKDIMGGGAEWAIAAAARFAQIRQSFADALGTAEIPRTVRRGPDAAAQVKQHCTIITADAPSLRDASVRAYGFCLELSQKLNWFNSWSRLCADQLREMRPADFPRANEVHGRSDGVSDILTTEALFTDEG